jgi:hypothetical protein
LEARKFQPSKKFHPTRYPLISLVRRRNEQKSFTTTLVCQECFLSAALFGEAGERESTVLRAQRLLLTTWAVKI